MCQQVCRIQDRISRQHVVGQIVPLEVASGSRCLSCHYAHLMHVYFHGNSYEQQTSVECCPPYRIPGQMTYVFRYLFAAAKIMRSASRTDRAHAAGLRLSESAAVKLIIE